MDVNTLASKPAITESYTAASAADNATAYESSDVSWANYHIFECTTNTCDVYVSLDGTTFTVAPVYMAPLHVADHAGAWVNEIAANKAVILKGVFPKIKILNKGGAKATVRVLHGRS